MVSEAEVQQLHEMDKVIEEDWLWDAEGGSLRGEASVICLDSTATLTLKAWKRRSYGFCLLYKSSKVIRRWDDGIHRNPDGETLEGSHKHKWHPQYEDKKAYPVDDITTDNVDDAFFDFLDEENIVLEGDYQRQEELTGT